MQYHIRQILTMQGTTITASCQETRAPKVLTLFRGQTTRRSSSISTSIGAIMAAPAVTSRPGPQSGLSPQTVAITTHTKLDQRTVRDPTQANSPTGTRLK